MGKIDKIQRLGVASCHVVEAIMSAIAEANEELDSDEAHYNPIEIQTAILIGVRAAARFMVAIDDPSSRMRKGSTVEDVEEIESHFSLDVAMAFARSQVEASTEMMEDTGDPMAAIACKGAETAYQRIRAIHDKLYGVHAVPGGGKHSA